MRLEFDKGGCIRIIADANDGTKDSTLPVWVAFLT